LDEKSLIVVEEMDGSFLWDGCGHKEKMDVKNGWKWMGVDEKNGWK